MMHPSRKLRFIAQDLHGIYEIDRYAPASRFSGLALVAISFGVLVFGIWMCAIRPGVWSQDATVRSFELALALVFFVCMPTVVAVLGICRFRKKPGTYCRGVRVGCQGIEIGSFVTGENGEGVGNPCGSGFLDSPVLRGWKIEKKIHAQALDVLVVLRKADESSRRLLLERIIWSSRGKRVFQMRGHDLLLTGRKTLAAVSAGSFNLIADDEGIYPENLKAFCERTVRIIAGWGHSPVLSCTLRIIPGSEDLDRVMAFGVLGGVDATGSGKASKKRDYTVTIYHRLNTGRNMTTGSGRH